MNEYPKMLISTPGGQRVPVRVIEKHHRIRDPNGMIYSVPLLDSSGVYFAARCIQERIDRKRNCPILVTGDPGIGKSTAIWKIARKVDSEFNADNVAFTIPQFEKLNHNLPFGDVGVYPQGDLDEAAHALYGPEYLKAEQRCLAKTFIVSRIRRQITWFAMPKRKMLNPHVREMAQIWIHISEPKEFLQGYARVRFPPPAKQSEYFSQKIWDPKFAFVFEAETGSDWNEYEKRKLEFVAEAETTKPDVGDRGDQIREEIAMNMKQQGFTQNEIAKAIKRNQSTVSRIVSRNSLQTTTV